MSYHPRYSWLAENYQSVSDDLDVLQTLCEQALQQQQQDQQREEEQPPITSTDSELRQFLQDGGLMDDGETLSQSLNRLEQMCTQVLQQSSATLIDMEG